jgi:esterase FrsA
VPKAALRRVQSKVRDMWTPGGGGWCTEWSAEAKAYEQAGAFLNAARCYGVVRFPIVCTDERRVALQDQTRAFMSAARHFTCAFERVELELEAPDGSSVKAPVHVYEPRRERARMLVVLSGGLDTGKTELHRLALALVKLGGPTPLCCSCLVLRTVRPKCSFASCPRSWRGSGNTWAPTSFAWL